MYLNHYSNNNNNNNDNKNNFIDDVDDDDEDEDDDCENFKFPIIPDFYHDQLVNGQDSNPVVSSSNRRRFVGPQSN